MAVTKITFPAKSRGDLWMSSEANEVKAVVNNNADELSALQATVSERIGVPALEPIVEQTATTVVIAPNVENVWTSPVASLSIQFAAGTQGKRNEYKLQFIVSGSSFAITLPSGVRWLGGEEPEWNDGYTYQVSIENSLAVGGGWPAS